MDLTISVLYVAAAAFMVAAAILGVLAALVLLVRFWDKL